MAAQRLTPLRQRQDVRQAEAIFDPILTGAVNKDRRKSPNSSALSGVRVNVQENFNANLGVQEDAAQRRRLPRSTSPTTASSRTPASRGSIPQYQPELVFSLNQPLLRNFGLNFAYLLVNVTQLNSEAAAWTYRAQLADFVKRVIAAYWVVVFTRQNLVVQQESLELAQQTLRENNERVRVGLLAPVAVKEAESEAAAREQQVIVATNLLDNALRTLRQIVYLQKGDAFLPRPIEPIDAAAHHAGHGRRQRRAQPGARAAPRGARPDARPAEQAADRARAREPAAAARRFRRQLRPERALGRRRHGRRSSTGQQVQTPFDGPYAEALDRLTSKEFYSYRPASRWRSRSATPPPRASTPRPRSTSRNPSSTRRQLFSDISLEVSTAVNDVVANMKRIQSSRVARELAEENLRNQQKRLEVGIATTKDVLDFQDDLTQARGVELRAATDYNISLAELARAQGTLLDRVLGGGRGSGQALRPVVGAVLKRALTPRRHDRRSGNARVAHDLHALAGGEAQAVDAKSGALHLACGRMRRRRLPARRRRNAREPTAPRSSAARTPPHGRRGRL